MPSDNGDEDLIDFGPFLQRYLAGDEHALETLPARERQLAMTLAPAFAADDDSDAETDRPTQRPRELDPIALALGLVPGPDDVLSASKLQSARKRARVDLPELVERLQHRGWDVSAQDVFAWHRANTQLAPALMTAVAETLAVAVRTLSGSPPRSDFGAGAGLLDDAVIEAYLSEWASQVGQRPDRVRDRAQRALASVNFRNKSHISHEDVLAILRALRRIDPDGTAG